MLTVVLMILRSSTVLPDSQRARRARVLPTVIQVYLSHANVSTTMGYCAADEDLHAAAELLRGQKRKNPAGRIDDFPRTG